MTIIMSYNTLEGITWFTFNMKTWFQFFVGAAVVDTEANSKKAGVHLVWDRP